MKYYVCLFAVATVFAQQLPKDSASNTAPKVAPKEAVTPKVDPVLEAAEDALDQAQYERLMAAGDAVSAVQYKFAPLLRRAKGNEKQRRPS